MTTDLLTRVLNAHGGLDRWRAIQPGRGDDRERRPSCWDIKGQPQDPDATAD